MSYGLSSSLTFKETYLQNEQPKQTERSTWRKRIIQTELWEVGKKNMNAACKGTFKNKTSFNEQVRTEGLSSARWLRSSFITFLSSVSPTHMSSLHCILTLLHLLQLWQSPLSLSSLWLGFSFLECPQDMCHQKWYKEHRQWEGLLSQAGSLLCRLKHWQNAVEA